MNKISTRLSMLTRAISFDMQTGPVRYRAYCVPPTPEHCWSLKDLYREPVNDAQALLAVRLGSVLLELKVTRAFAPSVSTSSGVIVAPEKLNTEINLKSGIPLCRNAGLPADGTWLGPHEAFIMSGGGCPVLVATAPDFCMVAHGSRDSLMPKAFTLSGEPADSSVNVVDQMAEELRRRDINPGQVYFRGFFGIKAKCFPHPVLEGPYVLENRARVKYLQKRYGTDSRVLMDPDNNAYLDLGEVTKIEARRHRFAQVGYDKLLYADGEFGYTRHKDPDVAKKRNLVIVVRTQ